MSVCSIVRDEMYFLPHFLSHYRRLGARDFLFLDDASTDGTLDYLLAQPDCTVVRAPLRFGEPYGKKRFGVVAKTLLPREFLRGRWVLGVDADEFVLLPPAFTGLDGLIAALEADGLRAARALMFDFFPDSLRVIETVSPAADPFSFCLNFDAWQTVDWPAGALQPLFMSNADGVRPRMFARLKATSRLLEGFPDSYRVPSMYKVPLVFWEDQTEMLTAHHVNLPTSDRVRLGLAHFKFVPGYRKRIEEAVTSKAYWQESIEYRFLKVAARELVDWPLRGPRTRPFGSVKSLEEHGLVFSRLGSSTG